MALSTTTTSFSSSTTATAPVLAFRTPFPQPASCSSPPLTTTVITYSDNYLTTSSSTFHLPDTSDPRYKACFAPAGDQFTFSPAVCPQGWTAWYLGTLTKTPRSPVSTAYCCAPDYTIYNQPLTNDLSPSCKRIDIRVTSSSGAIFVSQETLGVSKLPAWHISWQPTDTPTLSPKPPALESGIFTKWVPGSDPEKMPVDHGPDLLGAIGIILGIVFGGIAGLVLLCVCCHKLAQWCQSTNRGWSRGKRATPAPAPATS